MKFWFKIHNKDWVIPKYHIKFRKKGYGFLTISFGRFELRLY